MQWLQQAESWVGTTPGQGARPACTYTGLEDYIRHMPSGPTAMAFPNEIRNDVEMKFSCCDDGLQLCTFGSATHTSLKSSRGSVITK